MHFCPRCGSIYLRPRGTCTIDGTEIVERDEDPRVGGKLDRYVIIDRLGSGATSIVYKARHETLDRESAIKVLYGDFAAQKVLADRFFRSAQATSIIRHPNIVGVRDCGRTEEGVPFIVMDLAEGKTLEEILKVEPVLGPARAARIARDLSAGLASAHARGFVHRDIKPANVVLVNEGGEAIAKILDFGLVRFLPQVNDTRLTRTGAILGSPMYMAPEQCMGQRAGPAADLYAVGAVLFEMLMGGPPFSHHEAYELIRMQLTTPPPPLPDFGGLGRIVHRLLEKAPEKRMQNAHTLFAQLDVYVREHADAPPRSPSDPRATPAARTDPEHSPGGSTPAGAGSFTAETTVRRQSDPEADEEAELTEIAPIGD